MRRVLAFYQFLTLEDPRAECDKLQTLGDELALRGTILVAGEGVNGTVVGDVEALSHLSEHLLEALRGQIPEVVGSAVRQQRVPPVQSPRQTRDRQLRC